MKYKAFFLLLTLLVISSRLAQSADNTFIVGFHQKPGPSEKALLHGARGIIHRQFDLIPAMAVTLPEQAIENLRQNSRIAYIEPNVSF